jgi:cysteine desulfurase
MSALRTIYLDHNATSPPSDAVVDAVRRAMLEQWGNPSSPHLAGRRARALLAGARESVAALAGCDPDRVLFTSGATESCNHVLRTACRSGQAVPAIVLSTIEHAAVQAAAEREAKGGRQVFTIGVDANGLVDLNSLEDVVADGGALVSLQWANNEVGTIQPVAQIATMCERHGALLHLDACQAYGKLPMELDDLPVHFVSISGHKIGAPPGVGALYVRDRRLLPSLQVGGEQERSRRAGTENLPGIAGFGAAADERRLAMPSVLERWAAQRARFEARLPGSARINAAGAPRIANTSSVVFAGADGAALIARLDARGVCVSQGSACHSARPEPSHVLRAIGLSEADAYATLRFSLGSTTTDDDIARALEALAIELEGVPHRGGAAVA